jgi:alpha-glucosidase
MWWRDAVIYQIYPRSFQDSSGDGVGDLRGIESRLDHLTGLGVDALWLSPIYPSPLADFGYDVSDHTGVDPTFGTPADFDRLLHAAHAHGIKVLMDLVPCHTSIQHHWFREHPDWYVWADGRRDEPPNNWRAVFGGPAWTRDEDTGRWFLHSFYPEQPDLDWRNPEVRNAMADVVRFWLDRGVDGFRIDAIERLIKDDRLRDDPPASTPYALPLPSEYAQLDHLYSRNRPEIGEALSSLRDAAGDALLVGEVYLPTGDITPYLQHLDLAFAFELFHAPFEAGPLRAAITGSAALEGPRAARGSAWVLSNHDFQRLPSRFGRANARVAAMLLLTLPGTAFVYQGDEIGLGDGPGADPPYDRAGRDAFRHPMQWDGTPNGGFTTGRPWLPVVDPQERNVAGQRSDPASLLSLYRRLIALRPRLAESDGLEMVDAGPGVLAYRRGEHLITLNPTSERRPVPSAGHILLETTEGALDHERLAPHSGMIRVAASRRRSTSPQAVDMTGNLPG